MTFRNVRFTFQHTPQANTIDALTLGFLRDTSHNAPIANFLEATTTFWLPFAREAAGATAAVLRREALRAEHRGKRQRAYIASQCGSTEGGPDFGLHILEPPLPTELHLPRAPQQVPCFRVDFTEVGDANPSDFTNYLSRLHRRDRQLYILQALRAFWFPLACKHYGLRAAPLAKVAHLAIALIQEQTEHLRNLYCPTAPALTEESLPAADLEDESDFEGDDLALVPVATGTNGQPRAAADPLALLENFQP